jgi:hypothetical protein
MSFVVHGNNLKNKTKWERKSLKTFILACWTFFIIIVESHEEADEEVKKKKAKYFFSAAVQTWDAEYYIKVDDNINLQLGLALYEF